MNLRISILVLLMSAMSVLSAWASPDVKRTPANVMTSLEGNASYQWTELHWAARKGDLAEINRLAGGSMLEGRDLQGRTPLHIAVSAGQDAAVQALIQAGADVNAADTWGITPLRRIQLLREVRGWDRTQIARMIEAAGGHMGTVYQRAPLVDDPDKDTIK